MSYNKILVGTDGSETATQAVIEAAEIAKAAGAELFIVCAYDRRANEPVGTAVKGSKEWQVTAASHADDIIFRAREAAAEIGVESEPRAIPNHVPGEAMLEVAEEENADLIVIGNIGMTGAKRFLVGSVPGFIAHHAECDVLIARTAD